MAHRIQQIQRYAHDEPISPASPDEDILTWDQRPSRDWPNPNMPPQRVQQHGYQDGKTVFRHLTTRERAPASAWDDLSEYIQHARRANTLPPSRPRNGSSRERTPQLPSTRQQVQRRPPPGLRLFPRPAPAAHCPTCHSGQGHHSTREQEREVHNSQPAFQNMPTLQTDRPAAKMRHRQPQPSPPLQARTSSLPKTAPPVVKVSIPARSSPVPVEVVNTAAETTPAQLPPAQKSPVPMKDRPDSVIMAAAAAGALPPMFFEMQRQSYIPGGAFTLDLSQISKLDGLAEEEEEEEEGCGDALRRLEQPPPQQTGYDNNTVESSHGFSQHEVSHIQPEQEDDEYDDPDFEDHQYHGIQYHDPQYHDPQYHDTQYDDPELTDEYSPCVDDNNHIPTPQLTPALASIDALLSLPTPTPTTPTFTHQHNPSTASSFLDLPTAAHQRNFSETSCASSMSQYTATWSEKDLEGEGVDILSDSTTSSPLTDYDELMRELVRDMDGEVKGGVRGSGRVPGWAKALLEWRVDEERERVAGKGQG